MPDIRTIQQKAPGRQSGFSLLELLIALGVLLAVSGIVLSMMFEMTMTQASVSNRTDMHSAVRSVTEVLQQEISQAGRVALPNAINCDTAGQPPCGATLVTAAINLNAAAAQPATLLSTDGMFDGELLFVAAGAIGANFEHEVVQVITVDSSTQITAIFTKNHAANAVVRPAGSFITGIITTADGDSLQMYGDVNDDGNMVYVEYRCTPTPTGEGGLLERRTAAWNDAAVGPWETLLSNLVTNRVDALTGLPVPCFTFQTKDAQWLALDGVTLIGPITSVVNVAITLSARSQLMDPRRRLDDAGTLDVDERYDYERKALLTVSPRNVFQAWEMSTMSSAAQHVQPEPAEITFLAGLP